MSVYFDKEKKGKQNNPPPPKKKKITPVIHTCAFFPFMQQIWAQASISVCWWWLKHPSPRSDDQSGPPSPCVITADRWPISICPWSLDLPERRQPAAERRGSKGCVGSRDRKAGKTRVESGWRGERAASSRKSWREKIEGGWQDERSRKTKARGRCGNGRTGWEAKKKTDGGKWRKIDRIR